MAAILGISAFYHDSAAALVVDGQIIAAAQEERFSRIKNDAGFPTQAVSYCLREAGLTLADLDYVAYYEKPLLKFDRLLETYLAYAPSGLRSFSLALPLWLKEKINLQRTIRTQLGTPTTARLIFPEHHESHAASAFFPSPYDEAAILTLDGVGEWSTTTTGIGWGNKVELMHHIRFPHSIGLLYSAFTYYCGFKVNSGEYKLMGLAPFGNPVYKDAIFKHLIDLKPDGSFRLDMAYFNYCQGLTMTSRRFHSLFGGPPRRPEARIEQRHMDLAASIQAVTEDVVLRIATHLHNQTQMSHLVLAGGVALNCVANGRLLREGPFKRLWIQPAAGDAGAALGAALFVWHQLLDRPRRPEGHDSQQGSLLGPQYTTNDVELSLAKVGVAGTRFGNEAELLNDVVEMLACGKIVGWFQGRMEFGPRALGARSILGDPRNPLMQTHMNLKIKYREGFRPFAPSVLKEYGSDYFELPSGQESPYMLLVAPVRKERRLPLCDEARRDMEQNSDLLQRVNVPRSELPAITHVDYSARIQTVDEDRNQRFYRLIKAFHQRTGCPALVNTSFNVRGEPIVCTPEDAYRCFLATDMDAVVLEDIIVRNDEAARRCSSERRNNHLAQFHLD